MQHGAADKAGPIEGDLEWQPPIRPTTSSTDSIGGSVSRRHLTKEMCTPSPRCLPLHSRHMKVPYETVAHWGFLPLQSTQTCASRSALSRTGRGWATTAPMAPNRREVSEAHADLIVWTRLEFTQDPESVRAGHHSKSPAGLRR